jgi:serine/threonine protein kinase
MKPVKTVGDYLIDKTLSQSGMSYIHLAHLPNQANYKVALKIHLGSDSPHNVYQDLLRVEAEHLTRLRHPNIVRIFPQHLPTGKVLYCARAMELPDHPWYLVMEYIPGSDLGKYVKTLGKFPVPWIIELFYQLLTTVQFMHKMGYGHCDLKPENILLRESPDPYRMPQPILTDFGTTHRLDEKIVQPTRSLRYSPPEVIIAYTRKDIKTSEFPLYPEKIDLWSLGAILFELLTGRHLFNQERETDITSSILRGEINKVQSLRPEVHESLDKVLSVMLKVHPEDRPGVDEIIEAIEERISSVRPPRIPVS